MEQREHTRPTGLVNERLPDFCNSVHCTHRRGALRVLSSPAVVWTEEKPSHGILLGRFSACVLPAYTRLLCSAFPQLQAQGCFFSFAASTVPHAALAQRNVPGEKHLLDESFRVQDFERSTTMWATRSLDEEGGFVLAPISSARCLPKLFASCESAVGSGVNWSRGGPGRQHRHLTGALPACAGESGLALAGRRCRLGAPPSVGGKGRVSLPSRHGSLGET